MTPCEGVERPRDMDSPGDLDAEMKLYGTDAPMDVKGLRAVFRVGL